MLTVWVSQQIDVLFWFSEESPPLHLYDCDEMIQRTHCLLQNSALLAIVVAIISDVSNLKSSYMTHIFAPSFLPYFSRRWRNFLHMCLSNMCLGKLTAKKPARSWMFILIRRIHTLHHISECGSLFQWKCFVYWCAPNFVIIVSRLHSPLRDVIPWYMKTQPFVLLMVFLLWI